FRAHVRRHAAVGFLDQALQHAVHHTEDPQPYTTTRHVVCLLRVLMSVEIVVGSIPELATGGDILTTDTGARLPYSPHRTNPLNHAEALWDPNLQQQVLGTLSVLRPDGVVMREASSAPVYV